MFNFLANFFSPETKPALGGQPGAWNEGGRLADNRSASRKAPDFANYLKFKEESAPVPAPAEFSNEAEAALNSLKTAETILPEGNENRRAPQADEAADQAGTQAPAETNRFADTAETLAALLSGVVNAAAPGPVQVLPEYTAAQTDPAGVLSSAVLDTSNSPALARPLAAAALSLPADFNDAPGAKNPVLNAGEFAAPASPPRAADMAAPDADSAKSAPLAPQADLMAEPKVQAGPVLDAGEFIAPTPSTKAVAMDAAPGGEGIPTAPRADLINEEPNQAPVLNSGLLSAPLKTAAGQAPEGDRAGERAPASPRDNLKAEPKVHEPVLRVGKEQFDAPAAARSLAPSAGGDEDSFAQNTRPGQNLRPETFLAAPSLKPEADPALNAEENREAAPARGGQSLLATLKRGGAVSGDWQGLTNSLLARNRLNLGQESGLAWGRENAEPAAVLAALDRAKSAWPAPFRKQVGLGLVALGRPGLSANSMTAGASLLGASSSGEVLRGVLAGLKGELKILKLPPQARDNLGRVLAESGVSRERMDRIMAAFGREGLSLEELNRQLSGLDLRGGGRGLVATEDGLMELGQFLGSLGASTEAIDQVLSGLKPGQPVTGEVLRNILGRAEIGGLARNLRSGDTRSLAAFLQKMGAAPADLGKLENLLGETSGQLSLDGFLDFLDTMKEAPPLSELETLKTLLDQVSRDEVKARTPVFNEILIKLEALGDSEIDDKFLHLSPALQALRGGLGGAEDFSQSGGQNRGRENQERYRQVLHAAATGQDGPAGATVMAAETGGYGGRSEPLARQIAQKIILSRRRGLYRLKMNLNPSELGRLDIELAVKDGVLTARIHAESRSAYEALGDEVAELKKALAEGGVELAGLTLAHDDAESGQSFTAGLTELTAPERAARERAAERPGEVHRVI